MSGPNTQYVAAWQLSPSLQALRVLLQVSAQVAPAIARRAALSRSELRALELLMAAPHGPVELARGLGVTSAASSGIVDRLCARGHAVRQPHEHDRRRIQVVITDSGREDVLGHLVPMFVGLAEVDAQLNDEERAVVERYLTGAIAAVRQLL